MDLFYAHPLRFIILEFILYKTFRGTPPAIYDIGNYFMQKPLGRHPLRSMILGFDIYKALGGHPLRSIYWGSEFLQNLRGTLVVMYHFGICFMQKPLGDTPYDL